MFPFKKLNTPTNCAEISISSFNAHNRFFLVTKYTIQFSLVLKYFECFYFYLEKKAEAQV